MLVIKTGMQDEEKLAKELFPKALVLRGIMTVWRMNRELPKEAAAIISFGLCGGLTPDAQIAQVLCASRLITDQGNHECDQAWRNRIFAKTKLYTQPWYSSGDFDLADNPKDRARLFRQTGAWCIDDEDCAVGETAALRNIPFIIFRAVSDDWRQTVPVAAKVALAPDGGYDVAALAAEIIKQANLQFGTAGQIISTVQQVGQMAIMVKQFEESLAMLRRVATIVAPISPGHRRLGVRPA